MQGPLPRHIALDILRETARSVLLTGAVARHSLRVGAQKIPKHQMAVQLLGICRANVQMVQPQMGLVGVAEGLPARDAKISLMGVTDGCQPLHDLRKDGAIRHHHINVDAGLSGKPLYRSAAHVLNGNGQPVEGRREFLPDGRKIRLPRRVVGQYHNMCRSHIFVPFAAKTNPPKNFFLRGFL